MITSEEVRQALKEDNYYIVVSFIDQQEKVNELLELYKKKAMYIEHLYVCKDDQQINKYQMKSKSEGFKKLEEILIRIEELESELNDI